MELSRSYIERLMRDGRGGGGSYSGGSGSGGSGGSSDYAAEAGHAQRADHANTSDTATNADHATSAADLDNDSPVYNKFLRKDVADEASGLIGFLQGLWVGTRTDDPEHEGETVLTKTIEAFTSGLLKIKSLIINTAFGITEQGNATLNDISAAGNATIGGNATVTGSVTAAALIANLLKTPAFQQAVGMIGKGFGVTVDNQGRATTQTDDLLVLGRMIVNTLNIREVSYIGGTYLLTPAASTVESVQPLYSETPSDTRTWSTEGSGTPVGYRLLWVADDGTTGTMNFWEQGDQAFCQTFNLTEPGEYQNVSNHYWWRLVCRKGTVTIDGKDYHYADVANTQLVYLWDSQGTQITTPDGATSFAGMGSGNYTAPKSGDKAVMLGSQRYTNRQGAVQLTAEGDASIGIYDGINNYANLTTHEIHFFSKNAVRMSSLRFMWTTADGESIPPTVYRGDWAIDPTTGNPPISSWGDEWTYQGNRWTCIIPNGGTTDEAPGTTPANWQASDSQQGPAGDSYQHVTVFRDGVDRPAKPVATVYPPVPDGWAIAPIVQLTTQSFDNVVEVHTGTDPQTGDPVMETFVAKYDTEMLPNESYVRTRVEVESNGGINSLTIRLMVQKTRAWSQDFWISKIDKTFEDIYDGTTWDSSNVLANWETTATGVTTHDITISNIPEGTHYFDIIAFLSRGDNVLVGWKPGGSAGGVGIENSGNPRVYCSMATFVNGVIDANGWSDVTRWSGVDGSSGAKGDKGDKGDTGNTGPAGQNAALYDIDTTANTIVYKNGVYSPQVLSATYTANRDGQPTGETDLVMKVSLDGGAEQTYSGGNLVPGTDFNTSCRFLLYKGTLLVDSESVPLLKDGVDGLGSFVMDLTNEMSSINVDSNNNPTSEQTVQTGVRLYYGTTPITNPTITLWDGQTQITTSYANGIKYAVSGMNFTVYFNTSAVVAGKKEITIRAQFTHSGSQQEIEKVLTVNGFQPGATGPAGPAGYTVVAQPSTITINQNMDDESTTPTYFDLPQNIDFEAKQGDTTRVFTINNNTIVFKQNDGTTDMGTVENHTQYLKITALSPETRSEKVTQGYVACVVAIANGPSITVKIPVIVNYLGTITKTIKGDVETTIANKLTSTFTPEQDVETIEDFGRYVRSAGVALTQLQQKVNNETVSKSTFEQTSKLISMEVTGASQNLFKNATFERDGSGTGYYVPASWAASSPSYAYVSGNSSRINGCHIVRISGSGTTFSQEVYGSEEDKKSVTPGSWHTVTFYAKLTTASDGYMKVRSSAMVDTTGNNTVTLDGGTVGTSSSSSYSLNVSVRLTSNWTRHTLTFFVKSGLSGTHYISFDYYDSNFQLHSPRLVSLKTGGIDVAAGNVDITADNFTVKNSSGEQTLGLDANGNLALTGTVYAKNLYHNVQITQYSTISSYSENITTADMVIIAMPAPSGSARFYLTLKLPVPSDYPGKVITLIGANPAADYIYIYLQYGNNTDIKTIWGHSGIGNQANLKYMHEIVVISYNNNGNYEWRVAKWTEADANGYNTLHDVLKGYV